LEEDNGSEEDTGGADEDDGFEKVMTIEEWEALEVVILAESIVSEEVALLVDGL
jgi:hypothetical protein